MVDRRPFSAGSEKKSVRCFVLLRIGWEKIFFVLFRADDVSDQESQTKAKVFQGSSIYEKHLQKTTHY